MTGFLSAPTDQIGVPGLAAGAEVTPEGDLYTGWAEYELRFGAGLRGWDQPTRTLPDPGRPLLTSTLVQGPVRYTVTVFAVAVAGMPVAYETVSARNDSRHTAAARVAMALAYTRGRTIKGPRGHPTRAFRYERPALGSGVGFYEQPGQAFSAHFSYGAHGRDLLRSGLLLARGPDAPSSVLSSGRADTPTALHDGRAYTASLAPGARVDWTWQIPLQPPVARRDVDAELDRESARAAQVDLASMWSGQEAGAMQISVPERRVTAAYRAALMEILLSRVQTQAGWVQTPNRLQYQAFWIRDAALETDALDLAGLRAQAQQNLAFLDGFQQPDGLFISRPEQYDGWGQALWAIDEHAQLTGDAAYAGQQLPRIAAAIQWLQSATTADPLGLLPAGNPNDNERAFGHITGDDLWAAVGLRGAVADAQLAGRPDLAAEWQALAARFESSLQTAVAAAVARTGHIPPTLDTTGGFDWGNYFAAYPESLLSPASPAVAATVAWAQAHMRGGLVTYAGGTSLHDYLGFPIFETELEAGNPQAAIAGLYAELDHTTSTYGGWEWGITPWGRRAAPANMSPHGTFSAGYIALLRNLLVRETADGAVDLLGGASPAWQRPGEHISVAAAPTSAGEVSFIERSAAQSETLTWTSRLRVPTRLVWTLPWWIHNASIARGASVGSSIVLPASSGSLTVNFAGRRPAVSYAAAVAGLNAEYRAHGQAPPLVPAAVGLQSQSAAAR